MLNAVLVEAYKAYRLEVADADETTVNNELKVFRIFGRWLTDRAHLPRNPLQGVRDVVDLAPPAGRALSLEEARRLVDAADPGFDDWILVTALHGLRRGETNALRAEDINVEEGYVHIRCHWDAQGKLIWRPKFARERRVPIVEASAATMRRIRELPTNAQGQIFGPKDRRAAMARALGTAQLSGNLRFHDLRHTAYTHMKTGALEHLDPQLALGDIRLIFGHADATMDAVYDHRGVERLRRVAELSPLPRTLAARDVVLRQEGV